jgi:Tfp pilus assembly major pilin PilA
MRGTEYKIKQRGMMLLEVLITAAIASLLAASLTTIYLAVEQTYQRQHALQLQQAVARHVTELLTDEVHAAGYIGCARLTPEFPVQPFMRHTLTVQNALVVDDKTITVRYQSYPGASLVANMRSLSQLKADMTVIYHPGQLLLISDCSHAEIFEAAYIIIKNDVQLITTLQPLHYLYLQYAEIGAMTTHHYHLARSRHQQGKRRMVNALVRIDGNGNARKEVDGMEQLIFARDDQGVSFAFHTAEGNIDLPWHAYAASLTRN